MGLRFGGGGRKQKSGFVKQVPLSGAEQAVVTVFDEPIGEDALEEATNELMSGDGATLELVSG